MLLNRIFYWFRKRGGIVIRTAPTYIPQVVISKRRFNKVAKGDPYVNKRLIWREGYIAECSGVEVHFLSSSKEASVLGETADILLDMDEAHKIDQDKFEQDFLPMTASRNSPIILWGVAGGKNDVLYKTIQDIRGGKVRGVAIDLPAKLWLAYKPEWEKHYYGMRKRLGKNHPAIKMNYDLIDIEAINRFIPEKAADAIMDSDFQRVRETDALQRGEYLYYALVDIGGEDKFERDDREVREEKPEQDSTAIIIVRYGGKSEHDYFPMAEVVDIFWRTGVNLVEQGREILTYLHKWKPDGIIVDARGIGASIASQVEEQFPLVIKYLAFPESVTKDCYDFLSRCNARTVKLFHDDDSDEYKEFCLQLAHTEYEYKEGRFKIVKCKSRIHIDMIKACTYIRLLADLGSYGFASM